MKNLSEIDLIKSYVKGIIAGIIDTHLPETADRILHDYWHSWDNSLDINIWIDDSDSNKYIATLYRVKNNVRDDSTFQRLDYL